MKHILLRVILIVIVAACLLGIQPGSTAQAVTSRWTARTPVLDGAYGANGEWGGSPLLTYTNFSVAWQNDAQFLYLYFDVFGDDPSSASAISSSENFVIGFDVDGDGAGDTGVDLLYKLNPTPGAHALMQEKYASSNSWSSGLPTTSYAATGFGPGPSLATHHRIYEAAIRLSELGAVPGDTLKAGFTVYATSPSITEAQPDINTFASYHSMGLARPRAAFIYDSVAGNGDALIFATVLTNYDGFASDLVDLPNVASTDFSPYQVIVIDGHTYSTTTAHTWSGSAAAEAKIQQAGKPVLGIGKGGTDLFDDLGLDIGWKTSSGFGNKNSVNITAPDHAAWYFPNDLTHTNPLTVYSPSAPSEDICPNSSDPVEKMTLLANIGTSTTCYAFAGEKLNGVCYSLWGFDSRPSDLTTDGEKLFANMAINPICLSSAIYLTGNDSALDSGVQTLLTNDGFYVGTAAASTASTVDFSKYALIVVGWDSYNDWFVPANVTAIKNSHKPVLAMGKAGFYLYIQLGITTNGIFGTSHAETNAAMVDPLQPMMRAPFPILVNLTLVAGIDGSAGVDEYYPNARSPLQIGNLTSSASEHSIFTQAYNNTCYLYWGFDGYVSNMTVLAKNLFRNMAADPSCNYQQFVPITRK